ncbi:stage V sporulation protein AA [Priestia flexa]|uniref:stage V sporulation protein AA n=1 Tax=Priestia TaxID=2800373 RepID=UPI0011A102B1|nr:stage V sporulation protein AA [Priestia flexa]MCM3065968.1 stage V sporulation protein AA [Priestia flexa]
MDNTLYIKMRHRVQVEPNAVVNLGQLALLISEESIEKELAQLSVYKVKKSDRNITIIDLMKVIALIKKACPHLDVQTIGPAQTIVEVVYKKKQSSFIAFIAVWFLLFIGAAMAVMNFHEDVSMQQVHQKLFYMLTGIKDKQPLVIQIPYSFGLGLGMILFFNHVFRKRINEEPSPLEVEMFNYQQDLDQYVIMHENKESMKNLDDR